MGGDSTHKMSAYNSCHKPSFRDERQIERLEAETMVLYPAPVPNPVLPRAASGFSGRGMFPGGNRNLNWRAEGLRAPPHGICTAPDCVEHSAPPAAFYKKQREAASSVSRSKFNRKSPPGDPTGEYLTTLLPPSTSLCHLQRMKLNRPQLLRESTQTPHRLPSPGMKLDSWIRMKLEREVTAKGTPLPQKQWVYPHKGSTPS